MTKLTHKEFSKLGGDITFKKYGKKFLSKIGKKGAESCLRLYGTEFFTKLSQAGVAARKAKRDASRTVVEKIIDIVKGGENNDSTR